MLDTSRLRSATIAPCFMREGISPVISDRLRERFRSARSLFVLTGAGVSAESGVPTFRSGGEEMMWKGLPFSVTSSAQMVERELPAVWEWFDYRRDVLETLKPNPAHETLARWQEQFESFTLATQNVDGLHTAAGSRDVLELHGSIWRARCSRCAWREDVRNLDKNFRPPVCRKCTGAMRPDVVLFGEMLPAGVFEKAAEGASGCDICFVIGTSALVYPAAGLPEVARAAGAYLVEVNPEPSALSRICDETIQGPAGEVLPRIEQ